MKVWTNGEEGSSFSVVGNGRLCAYLKGPEIDQVFGAPYSAKSFFRAELDRSVKYCECEKINDCAIFRYRVYGEKYIGEITDYIVIGANVFVREFDLLTPVTMNITVSDKTLYKDGWFFNDENSIIYNSCKTGKQNYLVTGGSNITSSGSRITLNAGKGVLFFAAGDDLQSAEKNLESVSGNKEYHYAETLKFWSAFGESIRLPENIGGDENAKKIRDILHSVAMAIKVQQGESGGVMAGHNYHLAYVRDQYGVSRCLLALGLYEEAKAILDFYYDVFSNHGYIKNAQGIGINNAFHDHENDEVELTGYLVIQAFDYYRATGDKEYMSRLFPMLLWAILCQNKHIHHNMLPFNGDETYVAGGILPRIYLYDGSAESTFLYLEAFKRFSEFAKEINADIENLAVLQNNYEEVLKAYNPSFFVDGELITNNPRRRLVLRYASKVRGVCGACNAYFGILNFIDGYYRCPDCERKELPEKDMHIFKLPASILNMLFIDSDIINPEMLRPQVDRLARSLLENDNINPDGRLAVGYEYGLLLNALVKLRDGRCRLVLEKTLAMADDENVYSEYYLNNQFYGTRYRPWESAVNAYAIIFYLRSML